jgi:hypothetical protein
MTMKKNTNITLSRRQFIQGSTLLAGSIFTSNVLSKANPKNSLDEIITTLALDSNIVKLGHIYIKDNKLSNTKHTYDSLYKQLQTKLNTHSQDIELQQKIEQRIAIDFQSDHISIVSGWWLSETESQLCAIASLT